MRSHLLGKLISYKDLLLLAVGILCFIAAGFIHQNSKAPELVINKQESAVNVNKDILVFLSMGNKRMIADGLWIQTLLESDTEHYSKRDMKDWMFLRFKSIAKLDPHFYQNYLWGGQFLSIIKDDLHGAVDLVEQGLNIFPHDYNLLHLAGFTYYFELNDYEKGIEKFEIIMNDPKAPHYLKTIVNKMKVEKGFDIDIILSLVQNQIQSTQDETLKRKLKQDFYALKAEKDLKCLNNGKKDCDMRDAEGISYYMTNGSYHSVRPFTVYRLKKKHDQSYLKTTTTIK